MNLPNKLTVLRVIAVPFFIILYLKGFFAAALILFAIVLTITCINLLISKKHVHY